MKKKMILLVVLSLFGAKAYATSGDLTVSGTINAGTGGVKYPDGTVQATAAFPVLSSGTATPGTNAYSITIPATTGKFNLTYTITPTADGEPIFVGFNDNLTATGTYTLYGVGAYSAISGKVQAGSARTAASSGQYDSFDIIPAGNLIMVIGNHLSESNFGYWGTIYKAYLKYGSPQTVTKINIKCYNAGTTISNINWKIVALP